MSRRKRGRRKTSSVPSAIRVALRESKAAAEATARYTTGLTASALPRITTSPASATMARATVQTPSSMFGDTSRFILEDELYDSEESVKVALKTTATQLTTATSKVQCTLHKTLRDYHGFIRVQVGHDTAKGLFEVHQALITGRSKFFKAALSGSWLESKERVVKLPEDDPTTFHVYVHLLYTNQIAILPDPNPKTIWTDGAGNIRLAKLYVLAEKLHDVETKNHVLEAVIAGDLGEGACIGMDYPRRLFVKIVYDGTAAGSLARKLIVDVYARQMTSISMGISSPRHLKEWPKEFLDELLLEVLDRRVLVPGKLSEADVSKYKE